MKMKGVPRLFLRAFWNAGISSVLGAAAQVKRSPPLQGAVCDGESITAQASLLSAASCGERHW